jgi:hypothetical protein
MKTTAKEPLRFKVTEALSKDVGRALARLDPADMLTLKLEIGDIVEIVGKRSTVCKVMQPIKMIGVEPECNSMDFLAPMQELHWTMLSSCKKYRRNLHNESFCRLPHLGCLIGIWSTSVTD